ncbi:MAG TPA: ABC transporter permease [Thermoanaerobaculia bacterium]|nr:ABC transporter permease [Thermoanaerobaculia bacterium]
MRFFKLIRRNFFRNRLRTILTIALLATIFFFVTVLMGILHGFTFVTDAGLNRLAVENAMSVTARLPFSYEQKIRQLPGIVDLCKQQWVGNYYKDKRNSFTNFAVDHNSFATVFDDYKVDPKQLADWKADRRGALAGPELMERFHWKIGQRITMTHFIYPYDAELTIRGVTDHPVNRALLFYHMDYHNESMHNVAQAGTFWVKVKDPKLMAPLSQQIDAMFKNSEYPTETYTEKDYQAGLLSWMGNVELLFTAISGCAIVMVILLAAITMSMSARERVTEIAVLKAVGFAKPLVLAIMLGEFMMLTLLGGALGAFAAKVVFSVADMTKLTGGSVRGFAITAPLLGNCALIAAAVGLIAGGLPALRASNLSVVDGLRRVV